MECVLTLPCSCCVQKHTDLFPSQRCPSRLLRCLPLASRWPGSHVTASCLANGLLSAPLDGPGALEGDAVSVSVVASIMISTSSPGFKGPGSIGRRCLPASSHRDSQLGRLFIAGDTWGPFHAPVSLYNGFPPSQAIELVSAPSQRVTGKLQQWTEASVCLLPACECDSRWTWTQVPDVLRATEQERVWW